MRIDSIQTTTTKKLWLWSSVLLWLIVGIALVLAIRKPPSPSASMYAGPASSLAGHEVPDFSLIDANGKVVQRADLLGRPWVASFLFTQCTKECPAISSRIESLAKTVDMADVRFVTISVDPARDTPDVLKKYSRSRGVDEEKWLFLTGDIQQVTALVTEGFLQPIKAVEDRSTGLGDVLHSPRLILVGADARIIETYNGQNETDVAKLRRDIRKLSEAPGDDNSDVLNDKTQKVEGPTSTDKNVEQSDEPWILEDFELVSHLGQKVVRSDLIGKPWVASFIFTRCQLSCPTITLAMKNLHDKLDGVDVRFVGITVDPKHDSPAVLSQYAEAFDSAGARFLFLTGKPDAVYRLITFAFRSDAKEYVGENRKPGFEVAHSNRVMLVDAQGRVVDGFLATNDVDMVRLQRVLEGRSKHGMTIYARPNSQSGTR